MSSRGMEGPSSGSRASSLGGVPAGAEELCCMGPLCSERPAFSMPNSCCDALGMADEADGAEAREACRGWLPRSEGGLCAGTDPTDCQFRPAAMYLLETEVGTRLEVVGASCEVADSAITFWALAFSIGAWVCLV